MITSEALYLTCPHRNFKSLSPQGGDFCIKRVLESVKIKNKKGRNAVVDFGTNIDIRDDNCLLCDTGIKIIKDLDLIIKKRIIKQGLCKDCGNRVAFYAHGRCKKCYTRDGRENRGWKK